MNYASPEPETARKRGAVYTPIHACRVVIAEDEALPAEHLKRSLIRLGHSVVGSAQNGAQAIALTRELRPDVVVIDLRMSVMDGWTAMAELRREGLAPIVVVSALDDREALEQAALAGASAFLTKPVREDDLERALELAIARFADVQQLLGLLVETEQWLRDLEAAKQELRTMQAHLATTGRRAAMAGLAFGLTHEFNNALTPIIGNAQILALLHAQDPETVERTAQIIQHARRIAGWTATFRELSTDSSREDIEFSLNGLARDVFEFYAERFQRLGIAPRLELDASLPAIRGNPERLKQVLMLLVQNATEAMPRGGELGLRTVYDAAQQHAEATLRDTGIGIAPEHAAHLFEPGFTTKDEPVHAPAGWGLYTTLQIVQAYGGSIEISSPTEAGARGTIVRLRLPLQHGLVA